MKHFGDTERCICLLVLNVSLLSIIIGIILWIRFGYSSASLMFIISGGFVSLVTTASLVMVIIRGSRNQPQLSESELAAVRDPPPEYRHTWRREFMQGSPEYLKAYLQGYDNDEARDKEPVVWVTEIERPSHRPIPSEFVFSAPQPLQTCLISSILGNNQDGGKSLNYPQISTPQSRPLQALRSETLSTTETMHNIDTNLHDSGLPSYAEVQRWLNNRCPPE